MPTDSTSPKAINTIANKAASLWLARNLSIAEYAEMLRGRAGLIRCGISPADTGRPAQALRRLMAEIDLREANGPVQRGRAR